MQSIKSQYTLENVVKKSRFIGVLMPCTNEKEVRECLGQCQQTYPDASHITFAYRITTNNGLICRFHDAGEPSGTAGKPIFHHLEGKGLVNVVLVVIRYFGGIKLGTGGLVRAYGNTAKQLIEIADLHPYVEFVNRQLVLDYKQLQAFEQVLKKHGGEIISQKFVDQVHLSIQVPKLNLNALSDAYAGLFSG